MKLRKEFAFDVLVYNNAIIGIISSIFFTNTIGMINDYSNASNSIVSVIKGKAKFNKRVVFFYVEYLCCKTFKTIIVNSEYLRKALVHHYNCDPSRIKVMNKGIEKELVKFDRRVALKKKVPGSILFVKTDFETGGLKTLIGAVKHIEQEIHLIIIGPPINKHQDLRELLEESNTNGSNTKVEIHEYLPPHKVFEKMQCSEIFCVPSRLEAFGVANLEAMAMGCKIVSTNIGGIPEAVGGTRFAWLVEANDSNQLRRGFDQCIKYFP